MMGTAGEIPQAPAEKTLFMEDMSDAQLASAVSGTTALRDTFKCLIFQAVTYCNLRFCVVTCSNCNNLNIIRLP